jgi:SAM-dependent methyltransferase
MHNLARRVARQALKPVSWAYYALFFGRRSPLSRRLDRWLATCEALSGRGDLPQTPERWDAEYASGRWEVLARSDELARYAIIAGFLARDRPGGFVLDVGCGEGLLCDHLRPAAGGAYLGIDLSAVAIERAKRRCREGIRFAVADAEAFVPDRRPDAVVLNECLYYFHDPLGQAGRYLDLLARDGILIVSMFRSLRATALLRALRARHRPLEELEVRHRKGAWRMAVFRPEPALGP